MLWKIDYHNNDYINLFITNEKFPFPTFTSLDYNIEEGLKDNYNEEITNRDKKSIENLLNSFYELKMIFEYIYENKIEMPDFDDDRHDYLQSLIDFKEEVKNLMVNEEKIIQNAKSFYEFNGIEVMEDTLDNGKKTLSIKNEEDLFIPIDSTDLKYRSKVWEEYTDNKLPYEENKKLKEFEKEKEFDSAMAYFTIHGHMVVEDTRMDGKKLLVLNVGELRNKI